MRTQRIVIGFLLLIVEGSPAYANCIDYVCQNVRIQRLVTTTNGDVNLQLSGHVSRPELHAPGRRLHDLVGNGLPIQGGLREPAGVPACRQAHIGANRCRFVAVHDQLCVRRCFLIHQVNSQMQPCPMASGDVTSETLEETL